MSYKYYLGLINPKLKLGTTSNGITYSEAKREEAHGYICYLTEDLDNPEILISQSGKTFSISWFHKLYTILPSTLIYEFTQYGMNTGIYGYRNVGAWKEIFTNIPIITTMYAATEGTCTRLRTNYGLYNKGECVYCHKSDLLIRFFPYIDNHVLCDQRYRIKFPERNIEITVGVCIDCILSLYAPCSSCMDITLKSAPLTYTIMSTQEKRDAALCEECLNAHVFTCQSCNINYYYEVMGENTIKVYNGKRLCCSCYALFVPYCFSCEREFPTKELYTYFNKKYCSMCLEIQLTGEPNIQKYNFKFNNPIYKEPSDESLYFGFEFEVEIKDKYTPEIAAKYITRQINTRNSTFEQYAYIKHDGSLINGIEIVTNPMSFNFIKKHINIFNPIFDLKKYGEAFNTKTCGFHIHISKQAFTTFHLYKFLKFIYDENNRSFIMKISERKNTTWMEHYCYWPNIDKTGISIRDLIKIQAKTKKNHIDRHSIVNLTCEKTIEIRMFRGTIEKSRFLKNVQFVKSLFEYTRDHSILQLSVSEYLLYIKKNNQYRKLNEFIENSFKVKE